MKRILIINPEQFGYHTDTFFYAKYLNNKMDITYLCYDNNLPKIKHRTTRVFYVSKSKYKSWDYLKLILIYLKLLIKFKFDIVFIVYIRIAYIIKLFSLTSKVILDIRTGIISDNNELRIKGNGRISKIAGKFKYKTIISKGLANQLNINNYHILPLGAESNGITKCINNEIRFIYVGVLSSRKFNDTIKAYTQFKSSYKGDISNIQYNIIGYHIKGDKDKEEFNELLKKDSSIKFHGRIEHSRIYEFLKLSNIGISYIPLAEYFQFQPPTKTFEYLTNGLICIATKTHENKNIINKNNGILCDDNIDDLSLAMLEVASNINNYHPHIIIDSVKEYEWENIVNNNLYPYLLKVISD